MKTLTKIGILLLSLAALPGWADTLVANADRVRIGLNETLNLVLEYDERVDTRQMDFSALEQDFEILNNSTQSQVSIVNGRQDVSTRWTLILLPKRAGAAIIPSFQVEGNFSEAISIQVEQAASTGARSQPLSVELLVSDNSIAVMEQLLVTVRLIAAPQVSNLSGDGLNIEGAETTLLDQNQYSEVVDGSTWQINEWTYAVFADQPALLEIPGQLFSGVIGATSRSIFDSFGGNGQRRLTRSPEATIEVIPAPTGQYWFPASEVRIEQEWPDSQNSSGSEFRVGEPITRTVSVIAYGQKPETIPPLPEMVSNQFKIYADQPEVISQTSGEHLIGVRRESAAIVPTVAGEMTLPETRIPWWDVEEDIWKEAVLPAQSITILEAENSASLAPPENFAAPTEVAATQVEPSLLDSIWLWSTAAFATLSLILAWLLIRRPKPRVASEPSKSINSKEQQLWSSLRRDFKGSSAQKLRLSIETWCRAVWPQESASPLQRLSDKLSEEAAAELAGLEKALYGQVGTELPELKNLQAELKKLRSIRDTSNKDQRGSATLPPLNPI